MKKVFVLFTLIFVSQAKAESWLCENARHGVRVHATTLVPAPITKPRLFGCRGKGVGDAKVYNHGTLMTSTVNWPHLMWEDGPEYGFEFNRKVMSKEARAADFLGTRIGYISHVRVLIDTKPGQKLKKGEKTIGQFEVITRDNKFFDHEAVCTRL